MMGSNGRIEYKRDINIARNLAAAVLVVAGLSGAQADEFILASGKVVKGAIVSQTPSEYTLRTEYGTIRIKKSEVSRMVSMGTTPSEVEGDLAAGKGELKAALESYQQALTETPGGSEAAQRLQQKINSVSQTKQKAAVGAVAGQFDVALELIKAQKYDAAQVILDRVASQISPTDPMAVEIKKLQANLHYGRGMAAKDAVKMDVARQEFESAIAADPNFYPAYMELGSAMLGSSSTVARGVDLMEKGIELAGKNMPEQQRFTYLYMLGDKYYEQGNYAKAASNYARLIGARDRYPAFGDALDKTVDSYVKMGEENSTTDFQQTITNLNAALQLNPENQKALFLLGRIYLDLGQVENATLTLKKLVAVAPSYEDANNYLGKAYSQSHEYETALRYLSDEIQSHPKNYSALIDRAEVHIELGNFTAAEVDIEQAKSLEPKQWYAYYLAGLKSFKQKDYSSAQVALLEALDRKQNAIPVHLLMGRVLMEQGSMDGARQWFEQVANNLDSTDELTFRYKTYRAKALTYLGEISLKQNSPRQAATYLNEALQTLPDYAPALAAMGDTAIMMSNDPSSTRPKDVLLSDAEKLYNKAIAKDPHNAEYYLKLATYYQRNMVNREKALANYNLYVDNKGTDPRVNAFITELGGEARSELITTPTVTATPATLPVTATPIGAVTMPAMPPMLPPLAVGSGSTTDTALTSGSTEMPPLGTLPVDAVTTAVPVVPAVPVVAPPPV